MIKLLFLFLCFISTASADWDQLFSDEDDPTLFHHVNVITGNLNLCMQDAVIEGAKTLPVFRTYSSAGALESPMLNAVLKAVRGGWAVQGGWSFFPHVNLLIDIHLKTKLFQIFLPEPSGNVVPYVFSRKEGENRLIFKPEKGFGQCSGALSAKTNVANNILELHLKNGEAVLHLPNGGSRIYVGPKFHDWNMEKLQKMQKRTLGKCFYRLVREVLPSRHTINYTYDEKGRLAHVEVKNPSQTKTYAWMHLDPIHSHSPIAIGLRTSDRKSLQYTTTPFKGVDYICDVVGTCRFPESNAFIKARKGKGARIKRMGLGDKLQFEATYYCPPNEEKEEQWARRPEKKPLELDKVHFLEAPLGLHGEMIPFARFSYRPGVTEVRDTGNHLIRYKHDGGHLLSIEYCNEHDEVASILKFIWEGDRLKAKVMLDGQSRAHFSKVFDYDGAGNVIKETLWGTLTGKGCGPYSVGSDGSIADAEHYSRRYAYLPRFNIPIWEEEENGLTYRYEYKHDTDLPTAKFTCDGDRVLTREFLFYNEDNLLIAEITDDGTSTDPNDLSHVSERQIKRYDLDPSSGLTHTLTESYFDMASHTEVILKKVIYSYSPELRVNAEAVYDATGAHRYTIRTDYDAQGHVILKTTPLGHKNTYSYDSLGNLLTIKEVSSAKKILTYDAAGRPAGAEEIDHLGTIKQTLTHYDANGNLLVQTDSRGNETTQEYDAFGRCIQTHFPTALDDEGIPYTPTVSFTYDIQGNLTSTEVDGKVTTYTDYNTLRKPVQIIHADGTNTEHTYSQNGTLAQTIYADGTHIDYRYDLFQRMTSKTVSSANGKLLSTEIWTYNAFHPITHTDPNGLMTRYTYDGAGRMISEEAESRVITYSYDPLGFIEKTVEGDIAHVQIHDVEGMVVAEWKEAPDGSMENYMRFFYDGENKKRQAIRMTSRGEAIDLFSYDREFRLASHTDPENNITEFLYTDTETNALGQRVLQKMTIDPLRNQTVETHDASGRPVLRQQKDSLGNIVSQEELFYDRAGNRARRISSVYHLHTLKDQISVRWKYDLMGKVRSESEGIDKTTYFFYDKRGRVKSRILPSSVAINSTYDGIDRPLEMKSSDGTIHYQYVYKSGPEPVEVTDLIRNTVLKREYNSFGQLLSETNPYCLTFTWDYDDYGRCIVYTLPDLSSITYSYKNGHLADISRYSPQELLLYAHRYCNFDPNGLVSEEDLIHNLGVQHTIHDLLERPSSQQSPWLTQSISYGFSGLVASTHNTLHGDKIYSYDALNQLICDGDENHTFDSLGNPIHCAINTYNQITSGPDYILKYDDNGNPFKKTSADGITIYDYDALGRLIAITYPNSTKTSYVYDAFSRLIAEHTDNSQTLFLYDKTQEVGAMTPQGALLQLKVIGLGPVSEIGRSVAIEIAGTAYAPLHDFQGNIIALISPDQQIAESYQIDAFGREKTETQPLNPWRFSSKRSMGGLIFFGLRFYDPLLGRWLTPDPSGFADGPNLYVYALNSPLNRLDLFGLNSDPRFSQEMFRMNIPIDSILISSLLPGRAILSCHGFIAGVRVDWVVSSNQWKNLNFTPYEKVTGMVNILNHFQELVPKGGNMIGLITTQNGINTTFKEFTQNVQSLGGMIPEGTLLIGMHNPSKGIIPDCIRTIQERNGNDSPIVVCTRQFLVAISDGIYKINPNLIFLHDTHSEGGVIAGNAIKGMTEDQRALLKQQLFFLGIAPAKPLSLEYGREVVNIYSKQDFITGLFALKYVNNPKYDVRFVPCRSKLSERTGYIADHAYLGGTYQYEQQLYFDDLRKTVGFYDGKTR